ncbi:MAG: aldose 1-epimerase, partial [Armatimonadota bacterium]
TSYAIARGWGCNLMSWIVDGQEMMYCPDDLPAAATKITGGGNPILFPSVGRTWDLSSGKPVLGTYRIHGSDATYHMPNHGIVFRSEFMRTGLVESPDLVISTYALRIPDQVRKENYPFEVDMVQSFAMKPDRVELSAQITNSGTSPAPVAFGYHPYFRVSNREREGVEIRLPAAREVLLTPDTVLPTGETRETNGILKLAAGRYYDNLFSDLTGRRMSLVDRLAGRAIHVNFDEGVELLVVYAPDNSDFVCIEPWTRGLGAFMKLDIPNWPEMDAIRVLRPGETMSFSAVYSAEPIT